MISSGELHTFEMTPYQWHHEIVLTLWRPHCRLLCLDSSDQTADSLCTCLVHSGSAEHLLRVWQSTCWKHRPQLQHETMVWRGLRSPLEVHPYLDKELKESVQFYSRHAPSPQINSNQILYFIIICHYSPVYFFFKPNIHVHVTLDIHIYIIKNNECTVWRLMIGIIF